MHFEQLWELCEDLNKNSEINCSNIIDEVLMKLNVYKSLISTSNTSEEVIKAKSRLLGEILFSITKLSLLDSINVYDSLLVSYNTRK